MGTMAWHVTGHLGVVCMLVCLMGGAQCREQCAPRELDGSMDDGCIDLGSSVLLNDGRAECMYVCVSHLSSTSGA